MASSFSRKHKARVQLHRRARYSAGEWTSSCISLEIFHDRALNLLRKKTSSSHRKIFFVFIRFSAAFRKSRKIPFQLANSFVAVREFEKGEETNKTNIYRRELSASAHSQQKNFHRPELIDVSCKFCSLSFPFSCDRGMQRAKRQIWDKEWKINKHRISILIPFVTSFAIIFPPSTASRNVKERRLNRMNSSSETARAASTWQFMKQLSSDEWRRWGS